MSRAREISSKGKTPAGDTFDNIARETLQISGSRMPLSNCRDLSLPGLKTTFVVKRGSLRTTVHWIEARSPAWSPAHDILVYSFFAFEPHSTSSYRISPNPRNFVPVLLSVAFMILSYGLNLNGILLRMSTMMENRGTSLAVSEIQARQQPTLKLLPQGAERNRWT